MEPMGQCPVCDRMVAPSCAACPQCGNTDWLRKTGKQRKRRAWIACPSCFGNDGVCAACAKVGGRVITPVNESEFLDTRSQRRAWYPDPMGTANVIVYQWLEPEL